MPNGCHWQYYSISLIQDQTHYESIISQNDYLSQDNDLFVIQVIQGIKPDCREQPAAVLALAWSYLPTMEQRQDLLRHYQKQGRWDDMLIALLWRRWFYYLTAAQPEELTIFPGCNRWLEAMFKLAAMTKCYDRALALYPLLVPAPGYTTMITLFHQLPGLEAYLRSGNVMEPWMWKMAVESNTRSIRRVKLFCNLINRLSLEQDQQEKSDSTTCLDYLLFRALILYCPKDRNLLPYLPTLVHWSEWKTHVQYHPTLSNRIIGIQ